MEAKRPYRILCCSPAGSGIDGIVFRREAKTVSLHSATQLSPILQLVSTFLSNLSLIEAFPAEVSSLQTCETLLFTFADFSLRFAGRREMIDFDDVHVRDLQLLKVTDVIGREARDLLVQLSDAASAVLEQKQIREKTAEAKQHVEFLVRITVVYSENPMKRLSWIVEVAMAGNDVMRRKSKSGTTRNSKRRRERKRTVLAGIWLRSLRTRFGGFSNPPAGSFSEFYPNSTWKPCSKSTKRPAGRNSRS